MPVGVMYQLADAGSAWSRSHSTLGSLDPDRLEADDEGQSAGEEQPGQRRDERLDVEVLDEDADDQPDARADEDASPGRPGRRDRRASSLAHRIPVSASTEPTDRSMPPVTMTNVMPTARISRKALSSSSADMFRGVMKLPK